MCKLYALTQSQDKIRRTFGITADAAGNLPAIPAIVACVERRDGPAG